MKLLDILLGITVLALIVVIIIATATRVPEPFTELYFEDHTRLPSYSSNDSFLFAINNLENKNMTYDVFIHAQSITLNKTITEFSVEIPNGEKKVFRTHYNLSSEFGTGRIIVELVNKNQSIHFWTTYSRMQAEYFGKKLDASCVPAIKGGDIVLKLNGTDGAQAIILNNGNVLYNITLYGEKTLSFNATGILDIWFSNDYYNETAGIDRNLFLRYLFTEGVYYEELFIDEGSRLTAFDCERTRIGKSLYSNGAFRVNIINPE